MSEARRAIASAKRLVVKVGSSALTTAGSGLDIDRLDALVDAIAERMARGTQIVLVSSGAIGAGMAPLSLSSRPKDLATQQAAASVGQLALAHAYANSFGRYSLTVGQVLLTSDDVVRRAHYRNAQRTFSRLLALGAVPVVNENDTVATEEIRFGDNDRLASLVAHLVAADGLVLLSDVDALYDGDPRSGGTRKITEVRSESDLEGLSVGRSSSGLGTGGMLSKVAAARTAAAAGIPVLIAAASDARHALGQAAVGTAFVQAPSRMSARRFWLGYAAGSRGRLYLDDGAVTAVVRHRRSLLAAGITGVDGDFQAGDVVDLVNHAQTVVARGVVAFDVTELPDLIGHSSHELPEEQRRAVVHADDLVPLRGRAS
ncbi:glutamate 5-kinase [Saccharomonospora viridis]|jgi:glutamate 5-kinase|uniref:Glutamate 5-kinase n=1 Tax=Saccharomonospora viridis (strain ATCC 15386 / DSM 43017 / JCM 3036 / CCUG 5913 / NBRC 12207 / NCIMB 9602 / P101) TaxID=471857 RepID=C7MPQ7_SACVD|nr:glutamate 5-kinase [Saccharomonospora viridis]ACU96302.1 glutamate 5-kinase [Saccharomonospora viridis DSM 43017]SFO99810.1 glutamate 5-kinase [Saccharomonospora viridis]